jgi:hypothetical protein
MRISPNGFLLTLMILNMEQSWQPGDKEFASQTGATVNIDFGKLDCQVAWKGSGNSFITGSKLLASTTPWSIATDFRERNILK